MTNCCSVFTPAARDRSSRWVELLMVLALFVLAMNAVAQAPAAPGGAAPPASAEELGNLVGPIALYPDDLVAIILPASTNPLQLVQADRYLDKRKADPKLPVDDKWDDAVKSLLNYPDVVKMMSADLDWTSALGEAVVADQGAVLEAIQSFRRRAQAAGNLKSDGKQVVAAEKEIITIVPADPQVIYVPQYNPTTVVTYGVAPVYGYYPTPYPSYYYPYAPGAALAAGVIWGAAIGAAWNGGRYVSHYGGDANININRNTNINTGNINRHQSRRRSDPTAGGRHGMEVQQAARPGQQFRRQDRPIPAGGRCARGRRQLWVGRRRGGTTVDAARRRWRRPRRRVGRQRVRRLRFGPAKPDGQFPRRLEPRGHVRCRCAIDGKRGSFALDAERRGFAFDAERRRCAWRRRWRWWSRRRWRARRRRASLTAGASKCTHSLLSTARQHP